MNSETSESNEKSSQIENNHSMRRGPTIAAALVCLVTGVFGVLLGVLLLIAPKQTVELIALSPSSNSPFLSSFTLELGGLIITILGVAYLVSALLLWSITRWVNGAYLGIIVSMFGTIVSGLGVTFAPGPAASGLVVNVLIITMIATETWEEKMLSRR